MIGTLFLSDKTCSMRKSNYEQLFFIEVFLHKDKLDA